MAPFQAYIRVFRRRSHQRQNSGLDDAYVHAIGRIMDDPDRPALPKEDNQALDTAILVSLHANDIVDLNAVSSNDVCSHLRARVPTL
jgi:hypothetical protein